MQPTDEERAQLRAAMAALDAQRTLLGDAVVEAGLGSLRDRLIALETQSRPTPQRKLVTILFADVSGFTRLSESMDAEHVAGVMNRLWALVDRTIIDHGGRIDKHIGDAVMALWGAEQAREDDPERAVRAALAMQAAVHAFCADQDIPVTLRIGVNTGPVLLGQVGTTGEFTALGDAVNLAGRLEQAAPVGSVLISHDTYRHVRGIFDVQPQDPIVIKGKAAPVRTYIVRRAKARAFHMGTRGIEGVETRMIGRDSEFGALRETYLDVIESTETRIVVVIGEAGVGKSRLLYEFESWVELRPESVLYFKGRGMPNLQNVPFGLFRDLFAFRFNVLDSDSAAVALGKFRAGMAGVLEPERADVVGQWLGFDFSSSPAVRPLLGSADFGRIGRAHLTRYLRALTAPGPAVVMLEDIHWADDQSLDLIIDLAATLPAARLLIIAAARPLLFERRPNWGEGEKAFQRVNLAPLSRRLTLALVDEILQRVESAPKSLRELIVDSAEGNPYYVEELVKMLLDQEVIERDASAEANPKVAPAGEQWRVRVEKLEGLKIPPTLTGLLQARLDNLSRPERAALQRASVVGRLFWDDVVADLLETECEMLRPTLEMLRRRELIFRREHSAFAGTEEYLFKHGLLRDVVYETVLLKHRADFHGRVARWLEAHAGERLGEYLGLIAEHYVQAGEQLKAAVLLEKAGEEALQVGAQVPARRALERALALREAVGEARGPAATKAFIQLSQAGVSLGDLPAAEAALERGLALAREEGNMPAEAEALVGLALVANARGAYERGRSLVEAALPLSEAVGGRLAARAQWAAAYMTWSTGDLAAAEACALRALQSAREIGDPTAEIDALNVLGNITASNRDLKQAQTYDEAALSLARRTNHLAYEARALLNLGYIAYILGDYESARSHGREALERTRELGARLQTITVLGNLAQADLKAGDTASARRGMREALALARELGYMPSIVVAVFLAGQIIAAEGDLSRALTLYGVARAHPSLEHQILLEIDEEIASVNRPANEVEGLLAAGAALDFDTVVMEILDDNW